MSLPIEEAKRKLDVLEKLVENPHLILTDLFSNEVAGCNFLYQINVDGKYIFDYLKEYLAQIPAFENCIIQNSSYNFFIYVNALKTEEYQNYQKEDKIIKINVSNKTFKYCTEWQAGYEKVMNKEYEQKVESLSDWWKKYENLTIRKRVHYAFASFNTNKKFFIRIMDFIFWLSYPQKRLDEALGKEKKRIETLNKKEAEIYAEKIKKQEFYRKHAPAHIARLQAKQQEISAYLTSIGFNENSGMNEY